MKYMRITPRTYRHTGIWCYDTRKLWRSIMDMLDAITELYYLSPKGKEKLRREGYDV